MPKPSSIKNGSKADLSNKHLDAYLDSEDLSNDQRAKAKAAIIALVKFAKDGFSKPAALRTRPRAKSSDLDEEVTDIERVRAARRLIDTHYRKKEIVLTDSELEQLRAARRLVRAADRRHVPTPR